MSTRRIRARIIAAASGGSIRIGAGAEVAQGAILRAKGSTISIGARSIIGYRSLLLCEGGPITIGERSSINPYCVLYGHGGLEIGNDVRIAAHTVIVPSNHNFDDPTRPIRAQGFTRQGIVIEDDGWIGAGVRILDGSRIARGSVIGAGAVVRGHTAENGVYVGVPARLVKRRGD